jgi:hypothetical protein
MLKEKNGDEIFLKAVLIGVSNPKLLGIKNYSKFVKDYASFLSKHFENLIITPSKGVVYDIAKKFSKIKNKKVIAYYPDKDKKYGIEHIKKYIKEFDSKPINGDWYTLDAELVSKSNIVICLGFSPGSLIEIGFIKYH